jgi:hypothetical protein
MHASYTDDYRIETRFIWARCAAENARAMRGLIRAFQNDGWEGARETAAPRKHSRRSSNR